VATGRVIKPGRRIAVVNAEIVDGSGRLVATATSNCLVMPPP
jgi:acyl-coenzyme A thioesterase PaaI-like protein